ncbi:MAG: aldo/keto reductase [Ilumatobacteraceae bacterium]
MEYHYLGRSGTKVSEVCLGAMTFGREADEATSHRLLDVFVDAGGDFIDSADVYGPGTSEEVLGRWLARQDRERFVIATKVRFPSGSGPNDVGLGRKHILASIDASLRRLGTDYVDLYQIHCWDQGTPIEETLSTLDGLVRQGKVRYLGSSNLTGWQLQKMIDTSRQLGLEAFVSHQPQYNLLARPLEWEVLPACRAEGVAVLPWGPLRGGWLSGRYARDMGGAPDGSRVKTAEREGWSETWARYDNDHTWGIVDALREIAADRDRHPAQVALRWVAQRPGVTAPILGASKLEQLEINLGMIDFRLTDEEMDRLNAVSAIDGDYPYDSMITDAQAGR